MTNIVKVIVNIVFCLFFIIGWMGWILPQRCKESISKKFSRIRSFMKNNWKNILWILSYLVLLFLSSVFVRYNWKQCLDIVFFSKFNGYNIIWILWLFLLFIPLITVDNQWFKISSPFNRTEKQNQIEDANSEVILKELKDKLSNASEMHSVRIDTNREENSKEPEVPLNLPNSSKGDEE